MEGFDESGEEEEGGEHSAGILHEEDNDETDENEVELQYGIRMSIVSNIPTAHMQSFMRH